MQEYKVKLKLRIESSEDFTLISTGGIPFEYKFIEKLKKEDEIFVLSGNYNAVKKSKNLIFLPMHNDLHYPDIIHASTKVIGKVGYGTVVECWASQRNFMGYIVMISEKVKFSGHLSKKKTLEKKFHAIFLSPVIG